MNRAAKVLILSPLLISATLPAQLSTTGTVSVDLSRASVHGSVCVSNRPPAAATHFVLNAGLNVARVYDGSGKQLDFAGWDDAVVDGEARVYELVGPEAPQTLCVDYVGAFPSYPQHDGPTDFKGLIAFDGQSIRASEQSVWVPEAYDPTTKERIIPTTFKFHVRCLGCRFLYLNGLPPRAVSEGTFQSGVERPPLLFGGTGPWETRGNVTILNEQLSEAEVQTLAKTFASIEKFYDAYLGRPVNDKPVLLRMISVDQKFRDQKQTSWGFATWPTIALSGSIAQLADALAVRDPTKAYIFPYLAHETAHYYFGTLNRPSGPYRWMLLESMAEFMAIEAQRAIVGPQAAQQRLSGMLKVSATLGAFVPLDRITDEEQIGDAYRYSYIPLLLFALEKQAGPPAMQKFVRALLASPSPRTWAEMTQLALASGIPERDWENWRRQCLGQVTSPCLTHLVAGFSSPATATARAQ